MLRRRARLEGEGSMGLWLYHCGFYFYLKKGNVFYTICETVNPVKKPEKKKEKAFFLKRNL